MGNHSHDSSPIFQNLRSQLRHWGVGLTSCTLKLVVMAASLERSGKAGRISNLRPNTYHLVKTWWKLAQ